MIEATLFVDTLYGRYLVIGDFRNLTEDQSRYIEQDTVFCNRGDRLEAYFDYGDELDFPALPPFVKAREGR